MAQRLQSSKEQEGERKSLKRKRCANIFFAVLMLLITLLAVVAYIAQAFTPVAIFMIFFVFIIVFMITAISISTTLLQPELV